MLQKKKSLGAMLYDVVSIVACSYQRRGEVVSVSPLEQPPLRAVLRLGARSVVDVNKRTLHL